MKLIRSKSKNSVSYYIYETVRTGPKDFKDKKILALGAKKELDAKYGDAEAYAQKVIKELREQKKQKRLTYSETIDFEEELQSKEIASKGTLKNVGWLYLKKIYDSLDINAFFEKHQSRNRYSLNDINLLLTASRILSPQSKSSTFDKKETYFNAPELSLASIYRFLDVLTANNQEYQEHLFRNTKKIIDLKADVLYYDCTNYFFECEEEDGDLKNDSGDVVQWGLRRYGASKEHRPNPIVQMGLFTDRDGIPIAYSINPGNTNEQKTAVPLLERIRNQYRTSRFIYCSDGGLNSVNNKLFNLFNGNNYAVTQSLKKCKGDELDLILKDLNWKALNSDAPVSLQEFKAIIQKYVEGKELAAEEKNLLENDVIYKKFPFKRKAKLSAFKFMNSDSVVEFEEAMFVTFSAKYFLYGKGILDKQILRAQSCIDKKRKKTNDPNDIRRLISETAVTADGEIAEEERMELNGKRIESEEKLLGFYAVATNMAEASIGEILYINRKRWEIERNFRIIKNNFDGRPVYLHKKEHIEAHFAICYTALLIYRILEQQLNEEGKEHYTTADILNTLKVMNVFEKNEFYQTCYTGSKCLNALEKLYNLGLNRRYLRNPKR